ncbi:MAG: gfo/Idh/MocA family oxidoreductase, partial [Lachnospiraceae bacterium]|nr:gfo/Idh/MocA family oxidoreductase [Lachnospiraceae bacterium]
CTAQLQFENGTVGMLVADRASGQWVETMEIHGHNRSVYVNAPDSIKVVDEKEAHVTTLTPLAMGWAKVEDKLGFADQDAHFFDCLKNGTVPLTSAADAFKTHELMNRILTAAGLPNLE